MSGNTENSPSLVLDVSNLEEKSTKVLHPPYSNNIPPTRRHSDISTISNNSAGKNSRRRSKVIDTLNQLVVTSKPHQSLQTYLNHQQWNHSLLETYINRSFYLGVSPFRIEFCPTTAYPKFLTFRIAKFVFVLWNLFAFLHDVCQLRLLTLSYEQFKRHPKLVYVFLGYRAVLTYMQFRYFQLLWWKRYKFTNLLASFRKADLITVKPTWTCLFPTAILLTSFLFSLMCVVGGFNQLTDAESWTPWYVLTRYRNDILIAIFGRDAHKSLDSRNITSILSNPTVTTCFIGGLGALIDLVTEILHFCSADIFFLSTVTIWMLARELEVEHIPRHMFRTLYRQHMQIMLISREINEIVKLFLPPLTTATVISTTYLIHLLLQQRWFMAAYVAVKLIKPLIAYILAGKIADKVEDFKFWFFAPDTQKELNLSVKDLQIKIQEFSIMPIGMGQGVFYIDVRFMTSESLPLTFFSYGKVSVLEQNHKLLIQLEKWKETYINVIQESNASHVMGDGQ